jgi:hypothetical protein
MPSDFTDFYILYPGHPRFTDAKIIEDDVISVIIQKWQMILFTNKGDVFGLPNFGGDLVELLHETRLSAEVIEGDLGQQILAYIPEITGLPYSLKVNIYEDPERYQEWMEILFTISEYEVYITVI